MKEYIILSSRSVEELATFVNNHIKQGYIPLGGITDTGTDTTHGFFLQAVVLKYVVK